MEVSVDVIDYMGTYGDGVLVLLAIGIDGQYSEATFFYTETSLLLTVDESVEQAIGGPVEEWEGYRPILEEILSRLAPAPQVARQLAPVDVDLYLTEPKRSFVNEEVDPAEVVAATQSNL